MKGLMVKHKGYIPGFFTTDTMCGANFSYFSNPTIVKTWRSVTCKNCLRSKP